MLLLLGTWDAAEEELALRAAMSRAAGLTLV
jgi:hypothetical protein